jgi:hypothetical protein
VIRTKSPAKKENFTLDGFEAALKFDASNSPPDQQLVGTQSTSLGSDISNPKPSLTKEPTQLMLYGYSPDSQWAAIHHYESVSGGIICEDYDRGPPAERRKYHGGFGYDGHIHPRPLTQAERALAMDYKGGQSWIKVTFDSIEAADRAMYNSPHLIQGHWVYAAPYRGQPREPDEPIIAHPEDRDQGLLGAPKPTGRAQTIGPSFTMSSLIRSPSNSRATATLPRSFVTNNSVPEALENDIESSTTASSATALEPSYPDLRQRQPSNGGVQPGPATERPDVFKHFPDMKRTVLRPATEAFLPQPSWWERWLKPLISSGLMPGDVIGATVPRLEDGSFDWKTASFYWRACYWLDSCLGTDLCGMREG